MLSLSKHRSLALIEEPQRARQRNGVEHVRPDGDHHVHGLGFDQLLPQFLLGGTRVGGGIGHDETGATLRPQRRIEELNPQIVSVIGAWQTEGKAATHTHRILQPFLVHGVDVERRIGQDEIGELGGFYFVHALVAVLQPFEILSDDEFGHFCVVGVFHGNQARIKCSCACHAFDFVSVIVRHQKIAGHRVT